MAARKPPAENAVREQLRREEKTVAGRERERPAAAEVGDEARGAPDPEAPASAEGELEADAGAEGEPEADAGAKPDTAPESSGEPESGPGDEPDEPDDPLAAALRERDEYLTLAQRTQADFENYRKRAAREAQAATQRAKSGLVGELLPVVDNLERALGSTADGGEHLADGVKLVHSALVAVLNRNGVEQFDPAGEKFDPAAHEALSTTEREGADPGLVVDVIEKGYRLNGNVLRPARVVVSG